MDEIDWGQIASGLMTPKLQPQGPAPMPLDWGQLASGVPTPGMAAPKLQGQVPQAPAIPASPIAPEALAANLAARGVPPPPVDVAPAIAPIRMPDNNVGSSTWRNDMDMASNVGGVGAALTGKTVGAPMNIQSDAQKADTGSTDVSAQAKPKDGLDPFAKALQGIKAPAGPELQRLGTPAAPRPTAIKGGDIMALLQSLYSGPQQGSYTLPSTLGAAIRK